MSFQQRHTPPPSEESPPNNVLLVDEPGEKYTSTAVLSALEQISARDSHMICHPKRQQVGENNRAWVFHSRHEAGEIEEAIKTIFAQHARGEGVNNDNKDVYSDYIRKFHVSSL